MKNNNRKPLLIIGSGLVLFFLLAVLGFAALVWFDDYPLEDATPPEDLKTVAEFREWKGDEILGSGSYTDTVTGDAYQVLLGPAGRFLASGPSAYLFDSDGVFREWTPDMGDVGTNKSDYDLSSGNLKR